MDVKKGDKLLCINGYYFTDKTTTGKEYEVCELCLSGFKIKNDDGFISMPIESVFVKVKHK